MPHVLRTAGLPVLAGLALTASLLAPAAPAAPVAPAADEPSPGRDRRPNIVLVQLDDVSTDLMGTMRQVQRMKREGTELTRSFTVDSLCCPARAATFTGRAPHHNGVRTNTAGPGAVATGGWSAYQREGNPRIAVNARLRRAGYTTGLVGKFLNQYSPKQEGVLRPVAGWDDFRPVFASGYQGWGYQVGRKVGDRMRVRRIDKPPASASDATKDEKYVQTFIEEKALDFLDAHADDARPFFYVVSPYAAHSRVKKKAYAGDPVFPPAFRDRPGPGSPGGNCGRVECSELGVTGLGGYDDPPEDNRPVRLVEGEDGVVRPVEDRSWRPDEAQLTAKNLAGKRKDRARMLQSVDRTLARLLDRVERIDRPTYVVLTSDNGYHLGQFRLDGGKGTPYRTDTQVPLYVVGPGVPAGAERGGFVSNLDLAPTVERWAGIGAGQAPERDGRSFDGLLEPGAGDAGATRVFFEHTQDRGDDAGDAGRGTDPDDEPSLSSSIQDVPSYVGVRTAGALLVRLDMDRRPLKTRFAWELYTGTGAEVTNVFAEKYDKPWVEDLMADVRAWSDCGPAECRALRS